MKEKYWVEIGYCVMSEDCQVTSYFSTREEAEREIKHHIEYDKISERYKTPEKQTWYQDKHDEALKKLEVVKESE